MCMIRYEYIHKRNRLLTCSGVDIMVFRPHCMFSIASQPSRCGQLADYGLNEYIDLSKLIMTD